MDAQDTSAGIHFGDLGRNNFESLGVERVAQLLARLSPEAIAKALIAMVVALVMIRSFSSVRRWLILGFSWLD